MAHQPFAPPARQPGALAEAAGALDAGHRSESRGGLERFSLGRARQIQVGNDHDDLAHGRYRTAGEVHPRTGHARQPDPRLLADELRIGEQRIERSCIVTAAQLITDWEPAAFAELMPAHLEAIFALGPELVLLGTGPTQRFATAAVRAAFGGAARRTRSDAARRGMPHVQRAGSGGAAGSRGAVPALVPQGAKMIGRRHKGRVNQPNNHSKLTDSNNCTVFFLLRTLLLLLRLPSSLCLLRSPSNSVVVRRQWTHVKQVAEARATHLRHRDFFCFRTRPQGPALSAQGAVLWAIARAGAGN